MATTAPYGSWASPITGELLVENVTVPAQILILGNDIYWNERRPNDAARQVIVVRHADGTIEDLLPSPYSARTLVHEYGGQSFALGKEALFFSNFADQRLYRRDHDGAIAPITAEPTAPRSLRFADPVLTPDQRYVICVRERHGVGGVIGALGVVNDVVAIATDDSGAIIELASGNDFYLAPRISPDGTRLAFVTWNHPNMPWDGTELWVADIDPDANITNARYLAGGVDESISQPRFSSNGTLHYLSDRSGYWNLYDESGTALAPLEAECGGPDWNFGQSSFVITNDNMVVVAYALNGRQQLGTVRNSVVEPWTVPLTSFASLQLCEDQRLVCCAGSASEPIAVVAIDPVSYETTIIRKSREMTIDPGYISTPRHLTFPTTDDKSAHALYYSPKNKDFQGAPGERPPLIVQSHGGPTANARQLFDPEIQYWTSRGFAVVDVDYGGSTGYGRAYRGRLDGNWGITDVDDCTNVAEHLAGRGRVDHRRMVIHGGSAGGYTTLACLTFRTTFTAGASYYGVSDLAGLAADTHKFESRYLDRLVGPYPAAEAIYRERSPLEHSRELQRPVIFFQGLEDEIVPPSQAQMMVDALHTHGIPAAYLAFEGEQHGFRNAATIIRAIEAELYFYGRVMGITPADEIEPVEITDASLLIH